MTEDKILESVIEFVKEYFSDKESGHNWWHIERVWNKAKYIQKIENRGNLLIIELAALLHDIGDDKIDPETNGEKLARSFLNTLNLDAGVIDMVTEIMSKISFRDNLNGIHDRSIELDIVQDADRLDAIGAIGIARAFAYGGSKGNEIYNPEKPVRSYTSKEEYHKSDSSTINHFYEKLLLLKEKMNTDTGKELARERHKYMEEFLERFYAEWNNGPSTSSGTPRFQSSQL